MYVVRTYIHTYTYIHIFIHTYIYTYLRTYWHSYKIFSTTFRFFSSHSAVFRNFADKTKTFITLSHPLDHASCCTAVQRTSCCLHTGYRLQATDTLAIYNIHCLATAIMVINFTFQCFSCLVPSCRPAGSESAVGRSVEVSA